MKRTITTAFSNRHGDPDRTVFTDRAVEGLIGQEPIITQGLDWQRPMGRGLVVAAWIDGDKVGMEIQVDVEAYRRINGALDDHCDIGYQVEKATTLHDGTRLILATALREVAAAVPKPAESTASAAESARFMLTQSNQQDNPAVASNRALLGIGWALLALSENTTTVTNVSVEMPGPVDLKSMVADALAAAERDRRERG